MPTYEYKCNSCGHLFEETLRIAQYKEPTLVPCVMCGVLGVKQVIGCPNVAMDSNMNVHSAKDGFKDAMQKICEVPGIKNSKRASHLKDRYNL